MSLLPPLSQLHCTITFNKFGHPVDGDVGELLSSWVPTQEDLFQGLYDGGILLDIDWRCWNEVTRPDRWRGFGIRGVRAAVYDWEEPVIAWMANDLKQLRAALTLADDWCLAVGRGGSAQEPFPQLNNNVVRDRLSSLDRVQTLDQLERAGALGQDMYVARYGEKLTLQVDWRVIEDLQGAVGEPYDFRGFKLRLSDLRSPDWPVIEWAAVTFAELHSALSAIDQWVHAELLGHG